MITEHKPTKIPVYRNVGALPDAISPLEFLFNPEKMFDKLRQLNSEVFCVKMFTDPWIFVTGNQGVSYYGQLTSEEIDVFEFRQRMFTLDLPGTQMTPDIYNVSRATNANLKNYFDRTDPYELTELFVSSITQILNEKLTTQEGTIKDFTKFIVDIATAGVAGTFIGKEVFDTLPKELSDYFYQIDVSLKLTGILFPFAPLKSARELKRSKEKLVALYLKLINDRKYNPIPLQRPNLFDGYLQIQKDFNLSDEEVVWVYNAMQWSSVHYPAVHGTLTGIDILTRPDLMATLMKEQAQFDVLDWDAVNNMQILEGTIREDIRLNPMFALPRRVLKDLKFKNFVIPKGSAITLSPYFEHQNANVYVNPKQFNPYRWTKNKDDAVYTSFIPGGLGFFGCLGMNFAIHFITTLWAVLLRNYELSFASKKPQLKRNFIPVAPHEPIVIHYRKRI